MGDTIANLHIEGILPKEGDGGTIPMGHPISVKEAVSFNRFGGMDGEGVDTVLGPEMKSTW